MQKPGSMHVTPRLLRRHFQRKQQKRKEKAICYHRYRANSAKQDEAVGKFKTIYVLDKRSYCGYGKGVGGREGEGQIPNTKHRACTRHSTQKTSEPGGDKGGRWGTPGMGRNVCVGRGGGGGGRWVHMRNQMHHAHYRQVPSL